MRRTLFCLIDFDNATNWNGRFQERRPTRGDVGPILNELKNAIEYLVDYVNITFDDYKVRLYGGWKHRELGTTELAIWLATVIGERPFRIRRRPVVFTVAYGLYSVPGLTFEETYLIKEGLHYVKKQEPYKCTERVCAFWEVVKHRGKECPDPNCSLSARELFRYSHQKTVDTAIALDTVSLAQEEGASVVVFSSDYDLVPGLILAKKFSENVYRVFRDDTEPVPFSKGLLENHGIPDIRIA